MSRHRNVRNLNIADELDDDALSDGGDEELTSEQQAQMNHGLEQVRVVIGNEEVSGLSDNSIRDALWEYYFDVEKTISWAIDERERREIAKERKEHSDEQNWESCSDGNHQGGPYQYYQTIQIESAEDNEVAQHTGPRLPSIFLAQQQPGFDNAAYLEAGIPMDGPKRLSTISEKSERTEPSTLWHPRQQHLVPNTPRSLVSSVTTSYGQEIDEGASLNEAAHHPDPNTSRTTPSGSAIQRLSTYDPPPSNSSNGSRSDQRPISSTEPISSLKDLPSIPDLESKSSHQAMNNPSVSLSALPNKSQSKLSKLASSRASSISTKSESSRSSGTAVTGSIKTYPALRPSAQSERPPSSIASSKNLPDIPPHLLSSTTSATSSIVRRAIQAAMELENIDKAPTPLSSRVDSPASSQHSDHSQPPIIDVKEPTPPTSNIAETPSSSQTRPLSKLAILAQRKVEAASRSLPSPEPSSISTSRPLSKLAMLAQQKVDATRIPKLPKTTTEYLTPIANGSSVTTAITTSYQSLYSLTDPSRPNMIPKLDVVPLQALPTAPADQKTSKLTMKVKRAGEKVAQSQRNPSEDDMLPPISPIFQPKSTHARASPSAFASVLVHNATLPPKDRKKEKDTKRSKKERTHNKQEQSPEVQKHSHRSSPDVVLPDMFTFEGPSPDDLVLNARKGSSLGAKSSPKFSSGIGKS